MDQREIMIEIADYMLERLRKGNVDAEGFREMARHRNNLILLADTQVPELKWRKIDPDNVSKGEVATLYCIDDPMAQVGVMVGWIKADPESNTGYIVESGVMRYGKLQVESMQKCNYWMPIEALLNLPKE